MFNPFIFLLVAGSTVAVLILARQWVLERRGVDMEDSSIGVEDLDDFSGNQKVILGLLLIPILLFVAISLVYVLSAVLVAAVGISSPSA